MKKSDLDFTSDIFYFKIYDRNNVTTRCLDWILRQRSGLKMRYHLHEAVDIGSPTGTSTSWVIHEIEKVINLSFFLSSQLLKELFACIHQYIHTYIDTYMYTYRPWISRYIDTYIHAYIHTYWLHNVSSLCFSAWQLAHYGRSR